jgi:hypothetical protein
MERSIAYKTSEVGREDGIKLAQTKKQQLADKSQGTLRDGDFLIR